MMAGEKSFTIFHRFSQDRAYFPFSLPFYQDNQLNLYVADTWGNRVQKFLRTKKIINIRSGILNEKI